MNKTAIDVVLLPSPAMTAKVIEINRELLAAFDSKIILNAKDCLPHISLCMGVVNDDDIPEVTRILRAIAHESASLNLTAEGTIPAAFELTDSLVAPNGVIFANYKRAGEVTLGTIGG